MRMRLVRLVAIILREIYPTTMYQSGRLAVQPAGGWRSVTAGDGEATTHLKDVALAADDEPSRWLLVPLLGTTHVALAPRSHWFIGTGT